MLLFMGSASEFTHILLKKFLKLFRRHGFSIKKSLRKIASGRSQNRFLNFIFDSFGYSFDFFRFSDPDNRRNYFVSNIVACDIGYERAVELQKRDREPSANNSAMNSPFQNRPWRA